MALTLRVAAKKLRPYFQVHPIIVLTNLPLRSTIHKPDMSGRMAQWAIELREFIIQYKPRLALKGQILADFLVEIPQRETKLDNSGWWTLNVDDTSQQTGVGLGLQLKAPTEEIIEQAMLLNFPASNNEVEYEAIITKIDLTISVSSEKSS